MIDEALEEILEESEEKPKQEWRELKNRGYFYGEKHPNAQPPCQSPKKTKKGAKHERKLTANSMETTRLLVSAHESLTVDEELLLLGALEKLKCQHPKLQLVYSVNNLAVLGINKPWFLFDFWWLSPAHRGTLQKEPLSLCVKVPDREEAWKAEEERYREGFDKETAQMQFQQDLAESQGMKDLKAPFPIWNFAPTWNKGSAFLWWLGEELGLPVEVPQGAVRPYGIAPYQRRKPLMSLRSSRIGDKPFVVYDFGCDEDEGTLLNVIGNLLPQHQLVSIRDMERENLIDFLAVMSHTNLECFVGTRTLPAYAAWTGGVPYMIQLYRGEHSTWDAARGRKSFLIERNRISDDSVPTVLFEGLEYILGK